MVPVGTMVFDTDTSELLGDINISGERLLVAQGGFHGLGNTRYKSSVNRGPTQTSSGTPGESRKLRLELRVLADVGYVLFQALSLKWQITHLRRYTLIWAS